MIRPLITLVLASSCLSFGGAWAYAQMPTPRTLSADRLTSKTWSVDKVYFLAYQGGLFERPGRKMVTPSSEGVTIFNIPQFTAYMRSTGQPIVNKKFDGGLERLQSHIMYSEGTKEFSYTMEIISYSSPKLAVDALSKGMYSNNHRIFNLAQFNIEIAPFGPETDNYDFLAADLKRIFPSIKEIRR